MEYKGRALQCNTVGNNIAELKFDSKDESVNKFDKNLKVEILEKRLKKLARNEK